MLLILTKTLFFLAVNVKGESGEDQNEEPKQKIYVWCYSIMLKTIRNKSFKNWRRFLVIKIARGPWQSTINIEYKKSVSFVILN